MAAGALVVEMIFFMGTSSFIYCTSMVHQRAENVNE